MPMKRTEHTSRTLHKEKCLAGSECLVPDRQIRPGMRYVLLTEMHSMQYFNGKPHTIGKRHVECPETDMEVARLRENERR